MPDGFLFLAQPSSSRERSTEPCPCTLPSPSREKRGVPFLCLPPPYRGTEGATLCLPLLFEGVRRREPCLLPSIFSRGGTSPALLARRRRAQGAFLALCHSFLESLPRPLPCSSGELSSSREEEKAWSAACRLWKGRESLAP